VKLSVKYISDRFLPDKAIDVIDEAAARLKLQLSKNNEIKELEKKIKEVKEARFQAIRDKKLLEVEKLRDEEKNLLNMLKLVSQESNAEVPVLSEDDVRK